LSVRKFGFMLGLTSTARLPLSPPPVLLVDAAPHGKGSREDGAQRENGVA
jgi:hypothetical protein